MSPLSCPWIPLVACLRLAACVLDGPRSTLEGAYRAGGQPWTVDAHSIFGDTATGIARAFTRR